MNSREPDITPTLSLSALDLSDDDVKTIDALSNRTGNRNVVVGWLVCVEGRDKGRDFRLCAERNRIGRSLDIEVGLADRTVSRGTQVIVSYDVRRNLFHIYPGPGRGIVYVNEQELTLTQELGAYDMIEIGETKLMFVPFCGEAFTWR
jgi:hypothetical protein